MRATTSGSLSRDLHQAVADLHRVDPRVGLFRFCVLGAIFLSLVVLVWSNPSPILLGMVTPLAGLFYAFWLICTHDMAHQTLTGWVQFETIAPRLLSWPMLWPYGVYAELHRLHHAWNGSDLRDPERVQWTQQEYRQAHPCWRWYVRHQWSLDILVFGGLGLIFKTWAKGWRWRSLVPRLRQQLLLDAIAMALVHSVLLSWAIACGQVGRYLWFWFLLERAIGIVVQTRDHLEHYALWGKAETHILTQLYASRNLKTHPWVGWLMGGLTYHAVHHAFPTIPFNQLPEAFQRIQGVLQARGLPLMKLDGGYIEQTLTLASHPSPIGDRALQDTLNA